MNMDGDRDWFLLFGSFVWEDIGSLLMYYRS